MIIYILRFNDYMDKDSVSKCYDLLYDYLKSCGIKVINETINAYVRIKNVVRLSF